MKKYIILFLCLSSLCLYSQGPIEGVRNFLLGTYSGTYQSYDNWPNSPVLPAGVKITALPNDTIGLIAHDRLNNITDTMFVWFAYDINHQFVVDTGLYFPDFVPCGDITPAQDSIMYARCLPSNWGNPSGLFLLKAASHTFPTSIINNYKIKFSIYPNPAQTAIRILNGEHYTNYQIVNSVGQCIMSGKLDNNEIEISGLSNGIYYVRVNNKNSHLVKLLVKE